MAQAINLTTNTEYTLNDLLGDTVINQGVTKVRFQSNGVTATFLLKQTDSQGYASDGETMESGKPKICELDPYDKFKVTFSSGTVTAKIVK